MCISAVLGLGSAVMGSRSARNAARAQEAAANRDLEFQRETRDLIFDRMAPFYDQGVTAQNALAFNMGLGPRPMIGGTAPQIETFTEASGAPGMAIDDNTWLDGFGYRPTGLGRDGAERLAAWDAAARARQGGGGSVTRFRVGGNVFNTMEEAQAWANANPQGGMEYQGFQATPGFQFQMDQGTAAVNALAGARGGLDSGRTRQDLLTFGQGLANQEFNNYLNRLTGMAGQGFNAAGATANAATNAAAGTSNALAGIGNAQSAGAIGAGNAWQNAFSNLAGLNQYQRATTGQGGGTGAFGLPRPF